MNKKITESEFMSLYKLDYCKMSKKYGSFLIVSKDKRINKKNSNDVVNFNHKKIRDVLRKEGIKPSHELTAVELHNHFQGEVSEMKKQVDFSTKGNPLTLENLLNGLKEIENAKPVYFLGKLIWINKELEDLLTEKYPDKDLTEAYFSAYCDMIKREGE